MHSKTALGLIALFPGVCLAQEGLPEYVLPEVVVTATRTPVPLVQTIQDTTVLTREDIRASAAADLSTLLRSRAGVEIAQQGGPGTQAAIFMRGTESDHTLILVDGVRLDSASAGTTAIDQIMLDEVERIEIVRGNVSSVYGSPAIGGVVQVFTRKGRGTPRLTLRGGLGADHTYTLGANYGGSLGPTRFALGATRRSTDGFSAVRPEIVPADFVFLPGDKDRDGFENTTYQASLSHELKPGHELGLTAFHTNGEAEFDGSFSNNSEQTLSAVSLYLANRLSERWESRLTIGFGQDDLETYLDSSFVSDFRTRTPQADWLNVIRLAKGQQLTLGLGWMEQKLDSSQSFDRQSRRVWDAAAGYSAEFGAHGLQLNLRYDDYDDVGAHASVYAGYGYSLTPAWRVTGSLATAFKAPTFNELYGPFGANPDLDSERARSAELGLQFRQGETSAKAVAFLTRIEDLINFLPPSFTAQNVDEASIEGLEFSLSVPLMGTRLHGSVTWQDPRDDGSGQRLLRRAKRYGRLEASRDFGPWRLGAEVVASGPRDDIDAVTFERTTVAGYGVVNLRGGYAFGENIRLDWRLENLLNKDYSLVDGYQTQDRALFAYISWQP
jgi:vitamin B12 transporter